MSEIKAQIFGILLVVAVFASVGAVLVSAFSTAANDAAEKIEEQPNLSTNGLGNLTFNR